jgi:cell division ATPase FtsA
MDTRIGYPNEHLAGNSSEEISSPLFATAVGLVMNSVANNTQSAYKLEMKQNYPPQRPMQSQPIVEEIKEYEQFRPPERPPLAQTATLPRILIDEIVSGTARYGTPKHLLISIVYYLREIELLEDELRQYTLQIQKEPLPPQIPNISLKQALADEERMDNIVREMRKFRVEAHFYYNFINTNASANFYIAKFKTVAHNYLSRIKEKIIRMKDKTDELLLLALNNKRDAEQIVRRLRVSMQSRDITRNIM